MKRIVVLPVLLMLVFGAWVGAEELVQNTDELGRIEQ